MRWHFCQPIEVLHQRQLKRHLKVGREGSILYLVAPLCVKLPIAPPHKYVPCLRLHLYLFPIRAQLPFLLLGIRIAHELSPLADLIGQRVHLHLKARRVALIRLSLVASRCALGWVIIPLVKFIPHLWCCRHRLGHSTLGQPLNGLSTYCTMGTRLVGYRHLQLGQRHRYILICIRHRHLPLGLRVVFQRHNVVVAPWGKHYTRLPSSIGRQLCAINRHNCFLKRCVFCISHREDDPLIFRRRLHEERPLFRRHDVVPIRVRRAVVERLHRVGTRCQRPHVRIPLLAVSQVYRVLGGFREGCRRLIELPPRILQIKPRLFALLNLYLCWPYGELRRGYLYRPLLHLGRFVPIAGWH